MKLTGILVFIVLIVFPFNAVADNEGFQTGIINLVGTNVQFQFNLDMAGSWGILEIKHPGSPEIEIVSAVILLSRDGTVKNSEEIFFDIRAEKADCADILSISREPENTAVEFISTLDFTRNETGIAVINYIQDGFFRTYYNSNLIDIMMDD